MDENRLRELLDAATADPSSRTVDDALAHVQRRRTDRRLRRRAGGALVVAFCLIGVAAYNAEQHSARESLRFARLPPSSTTEASTTTTEESTTTTEPDAGVDGEVPTPTSEAGPVLGPEALLVKSMESYTYAINPDGTALTRLELPIDATQATWSPDRRRIAYRTGHDVTGRVWVADADGSNARSLVEGVTPRWSPDGRTLAIGCGADGETFFTHVCVVNVESGERTVVADGAWIPTWSPDGTQLAVRVGDTDAFNPGTGIDIIDLTDSSRTPVAFPAEQAPQGIEAIQWSPDGTRLLFADFDWRNGRDSFTPLYLFLVSIDGAAVQQLTFGRIEDLSPAWSPDGTQIAFVRVAETESQEGVFLLTVATGELQLVPNTHLFPSFGTTVDSQPATQVDW